MIVPNTGLQQALLAGLNSEHQLRLSTGFSQTFIAGLLETSGMTPISEDPLIAIEEQAITDP